jgi:hypothetical protein
MRTGVTKRVAAMEIGRRGLFTGFSTRFWGFHRVNDYDWLQRAGVESGT